MHLWAAGICDDKGITSHASIEMKIFIVGCVRDAEDIVGWVYAYHLSLGIDGMIIIDDGSSDCTPWILKRLAESTGKIEIIRIDNNMYDQEKSISEAITCATKAGADIIVHLDSDEFYYSNTDFYQTLITNYPFCIRCNVKNFVQSRSVTTSSAIDCLSVSFRAPIMGSRLDAMERRCAFVNAEFPSKLIVPAKRDLVLAKGAHRATFQGYMERTTDIEILHLPLRSKLNLYQRAQWAIRRQLLAEQNDVSYQVYMFERMAKNGKLEEEWIFNSHNHGVMINGNLHFSMIYDARWRTCMLAAALYLNEFDPNLLDWMLSYNTSASKITRN